MRNALGINAAVTVQLVYAAVRQKAVAGVQKIGTLAAVRGKPLADAAVRHNVLRYDTPAAQPFPSPRIRLFQSAADFIYLVNLCADASCMRISAASIA